MPLKKPAIVIATPSVTISVADASQIEFAVSQAIRLLNTAKAAASQPNLEIIDDIDRGCYGLNDHPLENLDELLQIPDSELGLSSEMRNALEFIAYPAVQQSPPPVS